MRLLTNSSVMTPPASIRDAIASVEQLRRSRLHVTANDDPFPRFRQVGIQSGLTGRHISDVLLAAIAIEHDATLYTADRGFGRFAGLKWRHPLTGT